MTRKNQLAVAIVSAFLLCIGLQNSFTAQAQRPDDRVGDSLQTYMEGHAGKGGATELPLRAYTMLRVPDAFEPSL
jgi:hypothetical protein